MGKVLMTGAGGGVKSDDVTASRGHVLQGFKTITTDSNDEVVEGLIPNIGSGSNSMSSGMNIGANHYFMDIPAGYYYGGSGSGTNTSWVQTTLPRLRQDIGATNPAMWRPSATIAGLKGTMPEQGGSTTVPGTANKTIVAANRFVKGNIIVSGDPNLVPANIKKNAVIFGVKGTHEGWVSEPRDLYYKGQNIAGFSDGGSTYFEEYKINLNAGTYSCAINFTKAIDVRGDNKLILEGYFYFIRGGSEGVPNARIIVNNKDISYVNPGVNIPITRIELNISSINTISLPASLKFYGTGTGTSYIERIRIA